MNDRERHPWGLSSSHFTDPRDGVCSVLPCVLWPLPGTGPGPSSRQPGSLGAALTGRRGAQGGLGVCPLKSHNSVGLSLAFPAWLPAQIVPLPSASQCVNTDTHLWCPQWTQRQAVSAQPWKWGALSLQEVGSAFPGEQPRFSGLSVSDYIIIRFVYYQPVYYFHVFICPVLSMWLF